jgi:hypothetical protein
MQFPKKWMAQDPVWGSSAKGSAVGLMIAIPVSIPAMFVTNGKSKVVSDGCTADFRGLGLVRSVLFDRCGFWAFFMRMVLGR